jgi:hypothetical protein
LTIKKGIDTSALVRFIDYVQVYAPALSHEDLMAIAAEFVGTHPKEIIIFASVQRTQKDFVKLNAAVT